MIKIYVRFYEELNDFLPTHLSKKILKKELVFPTSVKDLVESFNVPHTEVDLILVNGQSVSFDYKIADQDHVSVYPVFESFDISPVKHLQNKPLRNPRFFAEKYLWKLTRQLRLLGINTIYDATLTNNQIIERVAKNKEILLTRSVQQLMHGKITRGYCIRSDKSFDQTVEVIKRFDLRRLMLPFSRCMLCNGPIVTILKKDIQRYLEPNTKLVYHEYYTCTDCQQVYWKGSHYQRLQQFVNRIKDYLC
jgi:uncharacterized protein with PIN domain